MEAESGGVSGGWGAGLFLISFLDSSVLTFPVINDLLLIQLSIQVRRGCRCTRSWPRWGPCWAACCCISSREKGGGSFSPEGGEHAHAIRHWVERNGFVGMLIAALLPPPTPFKFFVLGGGV